MPFEIEMHIKKTFWYRTRENWYFLFFRNSEKEMKCLLQFCQIVNINLKEKRSFQEGYMFQYQSQYHVSSENKKYRYRLVAKYFMFK